MGEQCVGLSSPAASWSVSIREEALILPAPLEKSSVWSREQRETPASRVRKLLWEESVRRALVKERCWLVWLSRTLWTTGARRLGASAPRGGYRETHGLQEKISLNNTCTSQYTFEFCWVIHHLKVQGLQTTCRACGVICSEHWSTTQLVQQAFPRQEKNKNKIFTN